MSHPIIENPENVVPVLPTFCDKCHRPIYHCECEKYLIECGMSGTSRIVKGSFQNAVEKSFLMAETTIGDCGYVLIFSLPDNKKIGKAWRKGFSRPWIHPDMVSEYVGKRW